MTPRQPPAHPPRRCHGSLGRDVCHPPTKEGACDGLGMKEIGLLLPISGRVMSRSYKSTKKIADEVESADVSAEAPEDGGAPSEAAVEPGSESAEAPAADISDDDDISVIDNPNDEGDGEKEPEPDPENALPEDEFEHLHPDVAELLRQGYKYSDLDVRTGANGFLSVKVGNA